MSVHDITITATVTIEARTLFDAEVMTFDILQTFPGVEDITIDGVPWTERDGSDGDL